MTAVSDMMKILVYISHTRKGLHRTWLNQQMYRPQQPIDSNEKHKESWNRFFYIPSTSMLQQNPYVLLEHVAVHTLNSKNCNSHVRLRKIRLKCHRCNLPWNVLGNLPWPENCKKQIGEWREIWVHKWRITIVEIGWMVGEFSMSTLDRVFHQRKITKMSSLEKIFLEIVANALVGFLIKQPETHWMSQEMSEIFPRNSIEFSCKSSMNIENQ